MQNGLGRKIGSGGNFFGRGLLFGWHFVKGGICLGGFWTGGLSFGGSYMGAFCGELLTAYPLEVIVRLDEIETKFQR